MKKGKFIAVILLACILVLSFSLTACVPKKSDSSPESTPSSSSSGVTTGQFNSLESRVTKVEGEMADQSNMTEDEIQAKIDASIEDLQTQLDAIDTEGAINIPKYALVTGISHRYVAVTVYGTGDFPVLVYLFGEDLQAYNVGEDIIVEAVEYREYDVVDVFLYGQGLSEDTVDVTVPGQTVTSGPAPNDHTHDVTIDDTEISVRSNALSDTGTLMVIVVEPDDEWANGYEFELDIEGIDDTDGWVDYATASVGLLN